MDTGYHQADLPRRMIDRDEWRKRVKRVSAFINLDDDDNDNVFIELKSVNMSFSNFSYIHFVDYYNLFHFDSLNFGLGIIWPSKKDLNFLLKKIAIHW